MRLDRIGSIAWGLSTAVHLGIIVLALWRLAAPPVPEEPPPEAEPPAEQTASQELNRSRNPPRPVPVTSPRRPESYRRWTGAICRA